MIKFTMEKNGRTVIGLGLSAGNVQRLKDGKPLHINLEELNLPWRAEILIMYGETEQAIADELNGIGAIGPRTIINTERKSQ